MSEQVSVRPLCAVVTPVSTERDAAAKLFLLEAACRRAGFRVALPDFKLAAQAHAALSLHLIADADAVIVDLSDERPSCYFELGYAAALRRPLILLARAGTLLHQTPQDCPVTFYRSNHDLEMLIAQRLGRLGDVPARHFASVSTPESLYPRHGDRPQPE